MFEVKNLSQNALEGQLASASKKLADPKHAENDRLKAYHEELKAEHAARLEAGKLSGLEQAPPPPAPEAPEVPEKEEA